MTGVGIRIPADSIFSSAGMDRISPVDPVVGKGTLLFIEPRLWPMAGVPTSTVPNQSGWAVDLMGAGASELTVGNNLTSRSLAERGSMGTMHVAFKRTTNGTGGTETFVFQNQTVRNYVAANQDHEYFLAVSMRPTRIPHGSWNPTPSQRILGFPALPFGTSDAMSIRVNTDRSVVTGYPTTDPPRTFVQMLTIRDDSAAAAGVAAAAFSGTLGEPSESPSLLVFHNGGIDSVGMSFKVYFALMEDLTVSGRTPEQVMELVNAKHVAQLAVDGAYRGDIVTDPYTL